MASRGGREFRRQPRCVGVIVSQPINIVVECILPRRRDDAALTHSAADHFADAPCSGDQRFAAEQERADRCAQSFRQANRHRIEIGADVSRRRNGCGAHVRRGVDGSVEQTRAIEVRGQSTPGRERADALRVRGRQHLAAPGIFQRDEAGNGVMGIVRFDRRFNGGQIHGAIGTLLQRLWLDRAQHRHAAAFPTVGVRRLSDDHFFAARAMRHQAKQIGLRAADTKKRRLKSQHRGGVLLQGIDGRVFTVDIVTHIRDQHRLAHGARGAGDGIAAKIENFIHVR